MGIMIQVQLRASKDGLVGVPREQLPRTRDVLKAQGHLIIPIVFLLYMLFMSGSTVVYAAVLTIGVTILVAALKKATRMKPKAIVDALAEGAKQTVSVAIACACVGIVVGVSSKTGVDFHEWLHNPARQPQSENIRGRFRLGAAATTRIAKFFGR